MKIVTLSFILLLSPLSFSQGWLPAGARSMSMANASVGMHDVWSYHNNPGSIGKIDRLSAGIAYENRFLLRELQTQGLAVAVPLKVGVISVGGFTYGYTQYRSTKVGLGYSMTLSEKLYAGVQLNYQGIQFAQNYGSANALTGEAGVYGEINDHWSFGMSVFNLGRTKLAEFEDDRFSTLMRLGTAYTFSDKVIVSAEFEKGVEYELRFKSGVEYEAMKNFYVRGGVATAPIEFTFGTGYDFGFLQLDFGSAFHQILGWSPHFSLTYKGKAK